MYSYKTTFFCMQNSFDLWFISYQHIAHIQAHTHADTYISIYTYIYTYIPFVFVMCMCVHLLLRAYVLRRLRRAETKNNTK